AAGTDSETNGKPGPGPPRNRRCPGARTRRSVQPFIHPTDTRSTSSRSGARPAVRARSSSTTEASTFFHLERIMNKQQLTQTWDQFRQKYGVYVRLGESFPEDQYHTHPGRGLPTFAEQVAHMSGTIVRDTAAGAANGGV